MRGGAFCFVCPPFPLLLDLRLHVNIQIADDWIRISEYYWLNKDFFKEKSLCISLYEREKVNL
jgi:hypothetical protein